MTGACTTYFAVSGSVTLAGTVGAVCVAIVVPSIVRRGVMRSARDTAVVVACVVIGTVFFLAAFPAPAMAAFRLPVTMRR